MDQHLFSSKPFSKIIEKYPQYKERYQNLFIDKKLNQFQPTTLNLCIITNPKAIFNLIESQQMNKLLLQQMHQYLLLKQLVMQSIVILLTNFPFNCHRILTQAYIIKQHRKISFFHYFIKELYQCVDQLNKSAYHSESNHKHQESNPILKNIQKHLLQICQLMTTNCQLPKLQIQAITQELSNRLYSKTLSLRLIQLSFGLLTKTTQERQYYPHLYFLNQTNEGLKILLGNNKWGFNKGMTVWCWFKVMKPTESTLMKLKTEDNNQISVKIVKSMLVVRCEYKDPQMAPMEEVLFDVRDEYIHLICIEFQTISESLFSSLCSYQVNIKLNNLHKTLTIQIPKFSTSQFITDFSWFYNFIGCSYCIMISNRPDMSLCEKLHQFPAGISSEEALTAFLSIESINLENLICIINGERAFEGLLLNCLAYKNQGCYSGGLVKDKNIKKDSQIVKALLPYLFFLTLLPKDKGRDKCFDSVVRKYLEWYLSGDYGNRCGLFLLYFLELSEYAITSDTLQYMEIYVAQKQDFQLGIVMKYMDPHQMLSQGLKFHNDQIEINPISKLQLLFYLETEWKKQWNHLQGFCGWWSPAFFKPQNDNPYNPKQYNYYESELKVQWSVTNFITNDYCKCFLEPMFKIPTYADLRIYGNEYRKKEIIGEDFELVLEQEKSIDSVIFEKIAKSKLDSLKKLFKKKHQTIQKKEHRVIEIKEKFIVKCCMIELLSNVIGFLKITKKGQVIFTMAHESDHLDHMCIKAFKNERFVRVTFHIREIKLVRKRRYNQANKTLEFRLFNGKIWLIYFYDGGIEECLQILERYVKVRKNPYQYYLKSNRTIDWIQKKVSNFQYLMWLNDASGRSYFDITQYPVMPWVTISNEQKLNPSSSQAYRELFKNMGSFGPDDRVRHFLEKYESVNETEIFSQYHFGTHYSSSAIIFNYLIRVHPFSEGALTLQSGKFDCADRVFSSYFGSWLNATNSPTDLRELVPEIYTLPEVMINYNNYDFGFTQTKERIDNVQLPKWANGNPYFFVIKLRELMQSGFVEQSINNWIDLIFGYKQRGSEALKAMNIYFPLTYQDSISLQNIQDPQQKKSYETQIAHFGQNPCQIIGSNPHPVRAKNPLIWEGKLVTDPKMDPTVQKFTVSKNYSKQNDQMFNSVFQGREAILAIKFLSEDWFTVIQKHQYCVFHIENQKNNFISKQHEIQYHLEQQGHRFDYRNLPFFVPVAIIREKTILIGGFYSGFLQILFTHESKCNQSIKLSTCTITALAYDSKYSYLFVGDSEGRLNVFEVLMESQYIEYVKIQYIQSHSGRVNCLQVNKHANLMCSSGEDGKVNIYNLYSLELYRVITNPSGSPVSLCTLSVCPLYSILFYAPEDGKIYSYSLNGQSLDIIQEKSGFLYNFSLLKSSKKMDFLAYVNPMKELFIVEVPIFRIIRKIKIRKDDRKVSCIQCSINSRIVITGSEDGFLHLIGDKSWF